MMKKRMTQILGIIMTFTMAIGMIGCGDQKTSSDDKTKQKDEVDNSSDKQQDSGQQNDDADEDITYPLDTTDTLTFWSKNQIKPSSSYSDYTESPFHTKLAENTGVEVEWQFPAEGAEATQAYNLLLTENELPDIIFTDMTAGDAEILINDGVIYDLTEYLPKYAPDYWARLHEEKYERVCHAVTTSSGGFYGVEGLSSDPFVSTYVGPVVRQDWLEECGLDEPVTMEDWEEMLVAFKDKYNATFGFYTERLNNYGMGSGTGAYSTFKTGNGFYIDENGKVQLAQVQEEWKEYVSYLHKWWDMGLIDKDSLTMDDAAVRTKVLNNQIGASFTSLGQLTAWGTDAETEENGANWIGVSYPRTAEGEPTCMIQTSYSLDTGWCAVVTTSCSEEKLITALKWLNYGYTEEGKMFWNFGTEGESYYLDENGEPQWSELITEDPDGIVEARSKYTGAYGCAPAVGHVNVVKNSFSEAAINAVDNWIDNTEAKEHILPSLSRTEDENTRFTDLMSAISTYVEQMGVKFMTGDESLDNFDAFVKELNEMGLQEVLEIQQYAYDRYMK